MHLIPASGYGAQTLQICFDPDDQATLLEQVCSGRVVSLADHESTHRAHSVLLIKPFETLLCSRTLHPISPTDSLADFEHGMLGRAYTTGCPPSPMRRPGMRSSCTARRSVS